MAYIVDIILIVIFAIVIIISAHKGFFRSLIDLVGSLAAVVAARILSASFAETVYDSVAAGVVEKTLADNLGSAASVDYAEQLQSVLNSIPEGLNGILQIMGLDKQVLLDKISSANLNGDNLVESLMNSVVSPLVTAVIQFVLFVILAIVLIIAVKFFARLLDKIIKKLPVIKGFNKTLGGVFGVLRGLIDVVIIALVISVVAGFINNPELVSAVDGSVIIKTVRDVFSSAVGLSI